MANSYSYEIGKTAGTMVNVEGIIGIPPRTTVWRPWTVQRTAADGSVRGDGFLNFEWSFEYLSADMIYDLLSACGFFDDVYYWYYPAAMHVFVKTRDPFGHYHSFEAEMVLPDGWEFNSPGLVGNAIQFRNAVNA